MQPTTLKDYFNQSQLHPSHSDRKDKSTGTYIIFCCGQHQSKKNAKYLAYPCISVAYVVFGYTSSQNDQSMLLAATGMLFILDISEIKRIMYDQLTSQKQIKIPMKTPYGFLHFTTCPKSSRGSPMRRDAICLL